MLIRITKAERDDIIAIARDDGSEAVTRFPKKGPVPHDAVRYFIERGWPLQRDFWGSVAAGVDPEEIVAIAKTAGHASASRARVPDASIVEMIQAERLVECFEADLWDGAASDETLLAVAEAACAASFVCMPTARPGIVAQIRASVREFASEWRPAPLGHVARLLWSEPSID